MSRKNETKHQSKEPTTSLEDVCMEPTIAFKPLIRTLAVDQEQQEQSSDHLQPNMPVNNSLMVLNGKETDHQKLTIDRMSKYAYQKTI